MNKLKLIISILLSLDQFLWLMTAMDTWNHYEQNKIYHVYSSLIGSILLVNDSDGNMKPVEKLDGGDHSDDYDQMRVSSNNKPLEHMLKIVREKDPLMPVSNINDPYRGNKDSNHTS